MLLPALALVCVCFGGCGSSTGSGIERSRDATGGQASAVPSGFTLLDYDSDDGSGRGHADDGDVDDSGGAKDADNDFDGRRSGFDGDDAAALDFGHAPGVGDQRAIAALVRRYLSAAAAADGGTACALLVPAVARSVPEDLGRPPGPAFARGNTCPVVIAKIFREYAMQLRLMAATLRSQTARVAGAEGRVVLAFAGLPFRTIAVSRRGGVWHMSVLLDRELE